jgi:hypothetical protein
MPRHDSISFQPETERDSGRIMHLHSNRGQEATPSTLLLPSALLQQLQLALRLRELCRKRPFLECFPYVCPEPVLVK